MADEPITVPRALFQRMLDAIDQANDCDANPGSYPPRWRVELAMKADIELAKCPPCHGTGTYMYQGDCVRCGGTGKLKERP